MHLSIDIERDSSAEPLIAERSHGGVSIQALCIPPTEQDWSMTALQTHGDVLDHPELAAAIGRHLRKLGAERAYAPAVSRFSGNIASPCALSHPIGLPGSIALYRNRNVPADGTWLERGEAFVMSAGGCATIIALGEDRCIVAHAGRNSLIETNRIVRKAPQRQHMSVVDDAARVIRNWGVDIGRIAFHSLFAIRPEAFAHPWRDPEFGRLNRAMSAYANGVGKEISWIADDNMYLDISALACGQAKKARFGETHAGSPLPIDGAFGYTRHANPEMRGNRNLIIVMRVA